MDGCESWTVKKAECWRIVAFELWCWRRLLRVPWTARRSNRSILKQISPGCSLEGLMLKLKLQHFDHLMRRANSFKKTLILQRLGVGGEGDDRGWDSWMESPTQWTWVWVNSGRWWWTGRPGMLHSMELQRVRHDWAAELNWFLAQATLIHYFATVSCSFPKHCTIRASQVAPVVKSPPAYRCRRCKTCGFDPWVGRSPRGGHGNPLQYSCLENPMDRGTWWAIVHRVAQSQIRQKWLSTWYAHSSAKIYKNGPKLQSRRKQEDSFI